MKLNEFKEQPISGFVAGVKLFHPTGRVAEVIGFMREAGFWEAFVEDGEKTSVITVRDLLDISNLDTRLSKLMHQVPRMTPQTSVSDAASLMFEYRTRSMPVYDGVEFVGQVTSPSIVAEMMKSDVPLKMSSIMTREPVTIESTSTVAGARDLMRRKRVDQLPIMGDGGIVGVITSASIIFGMMPRADRDEKGGKQAGRFDEPLATYGMGSVLTSEITDSLSTVYAKMRKESSNYSIILNTGEVQGIVTYRDFLKALLKRNTSPDLPIYIVGLPDDPFEAAAVGQKFTEAIQLLRKGFPEITEARAIMKTGSAKSGKKRCQVDVLILSPKERYSYSVSSYAPADAFDLVNSWAKRLFSQRKNRKRKPSPRRAGAEEGEPRT
jgi:CBS domain-containing protein